MGSVCFIGKVLDLYACHVICQFWKKIIWKGMKSLRKMVQSKPCYNIYATIGSAGFRHYNEFGDGKNQVKTDSECLVIYITGIK